MSKKISEKHKLVVDRMFINGFRKAEAYEHIYKSGNIKQARGSVWRMMQKEEVKEYYDNKYKEFEEALDIDKTKMLDGLIRQINLYDDLIDLAFKDNLTKVEEKKFNRLTDMFKLSDINKARDMINKIIGAYAPEKVEVDNKVWTVGFAEAIEVKQNLLENNS